jgi:hypothetical protein
MANNKKRSISVITTKVTVPASTATSGLTLATTSGSNTFTMSTTNANFIRDAWIWDTTNDKLYKIQSMTSTTTGIIVGTFDDTEPTMGTAIIKAEDAKSSKIYLAIANGAAVIDGVSVPADYSINDEVSDGSQDVGDSFIEPYIVDAATYTSSVLAIVKKFGRG